MTQQSGFESFCGGRFWDANLTWDSAQPELTPCFERTVLRWVAPGWVWLSLPVYAAYLARSTDPALPKSRLHSAKLLFCTLAIFTSAVQLIGAVVNYQNDSQLPAVFIVTPAITTGTLVLVCVLIYIERKQGLVTSGVLFLFWLLNLLSGIPIFYTLVLHTVKNDVIEDMTRFVIFFILYGISLVEVVLFSFAEKGYSEDTVCPEATSSFLSRITYSWLNGLVLSGYKKGLEEKDVWSLDRCDQSSSTGVDLDVAWRKELSRCKWAGQRLECKTDSPKRHLYTSDGGHQVSKRSTNPSPGDDERSPLLAGGDHAMEDEEVRIKTGRSTRSPSLFRALARVFGLTLLEAHFCKLVCDILTFIGPTLQRLLIGFTEDKSQPEWRGFLYAAAFFALPILNSIFFQMLFHIGLKLGMKIKAAVIYLVYKKALVLSNEARKETTVGEIVNLMSVDAQRLQDVTGYLWMVWSSPLQIAIAVWLLWGLLGPAVLAGLAIMVLLIPANVLLAARQQKLQVLQMECKDDRIKLMDEVLNGMKVLKLYAWELAFGGKVKEIRDEELTRLQSYASLAAVGSFSWTMATFMVMLSTFTAYVLSGNRLEAETAFVALSLFNILYFPINLLPLMISYMVTATVSIKRLGKFLRQEEIDPQCVTHRRGVDMPIVINNATFAWGTSTEGAPALSKISLSVPDGSLVAVVGQVGAGKSSLISAMLGEMDKLQGSVNLTGSVAYVAQQAWIQNATLKDNILFGQPFDQERYDRIIEACSLGPDLEILPGGDQTEIGEKGINLSGGQKQRVSLARAVYSDADIYLLDDPLSAVDAHVGKHIYDKVIGESGLLKYKTRVLVTHGLHWLPRVDLVAVLVTGHVSEVGTYEQLLERDGAFAQYLRTYLLSEAHSEDDEGADPEEQAAREAILQRLDSFGPRSATDGSDSESGLVSGAEGVSSGAEGALATQRRRKRLARSASAKSEDIPDKPVEKRPEAAGTKLVSEEKSAVGKVQWSVFVAYARALGLLNTATLLISYLLYQASSVAANIWLTQWTNDPIPQNSSQYLSTRDFYLGIYGGLGGLQAVFILLYALMLAFSMVKASRVLHHGMLLRILRCPMAFFDTTPSGRILNRFSRDVETVDNILPELIRSWMNTFFVVLSGIVVIAYSTPIFLSVILPLGIIYYLIQRFYIPTSRQLKRLESTTRSPIYSHFSETVTGASTIRAYRAQERFLDKSNKLVDHNLVFYFASMASNRWLGFRLDVISACIVLAAALFSVLSRNTLTGGIVGLSISYALQVTSELNWMVRVTSDLETNIVSVERIKEYSETPTEAELEKEATRPDPSWPSEGAVTFRNYSTRYRSDLDLVLNNVNFAVSAGEKVGIVGRTGAGKSSLTLALFRIIEPSLGTILLDGVDVVPLGLHQLRSKITILPQDPVLFSGTLRSNIDPLGTHGESAIWEAVRRSNLASFVKSLPAGLNYECGEGGLNLSVGQRQLVCLARALLHKTRLLILDEATAAVDMETDELIQATIRREFAECTVLSIAHRINTIMDYDRILVLDKGQVAEYDTPNALLKDDKTIFYGMAKEAGLV